MSSSPPHDELPTETVPEDGLSGWFARQREGARRSRALDLTWRVGVSVVGGALVLAGVAMLALPGPGWGTIILGLAVLSTEFGWALRLRERIVARFRNAVADTSGQHPVRRWAVIVVTVGLLVLAAGALVALLVLGPPEWLVDWVGHWWD